jgi:hypothetical protein
MTCTPFKLPDGTVAILCNRGRRKPPPPCSCCGRRSSRLCDFKIGRRRCSKPLCTECAVHVGEDLDYCPSHTVQKELAL